MHKSSSFMLRTHIYDSVMAMEVHMQNIKKSSFDHTMSSSRDIPSTTRFEQDVIENTVEINKLKEDPAYAVVSNH